MKNNLSLAIYVKRRNGVPLGGKGSLKNMLYRSLGASSFHIFWYYWNPIWGYYLSRYIMKPVSYYLPNWCAVLVTFLVSGLLHDIAASIFKGEMVVLITPWFVLMGILAVFSKAGQLSYGQYPWIFRAITNSSFVFISLLLIYFVKSY